MSPNNTSGIPIFSSCLSACVLSLALFPSTLMAQGSIGLDIPPSLMFSASKNIQLEMNIGISTPVQEVDLTIINTRDPGGHSCCVSPPPPRIGVSLQDTFKIAFWQNGTLTSLFDEEFGPMTLDDNLAFRGEHRSTVAGFPNILTVVNAEFTEEGISGTFDVGADGGSQVAKLFHMIFYSVLRWV